MSQLTLDSKRVARVLSSMIYSIALHPSEARLLVAVGGRAGQIGLWDVLGETDLSVQVFQPHCGAVNCLSVCEYDQTKLYSTSHDGTVRRADLHRLIFDDVSTFINTSVRLVCMSDSKQDLLRVGGAEQDSGASNPLAT
uniref:WD repeat-containing protein 76 n=1 Tax=Timema shepardi TaxID=629360 RepID=A0A7R9G6T6_TIMSH|nr:unnamed protein product [Timema shepardi]